MRHSLHESLFLETPGMDYRHLHRYFMAIRNKHVAHSGNELETNEAVVPLQRRADGSLQAGTVKKVHLTLAHVHHLEVQQLGSMASYAGGHAREAYEDARRRAVEQVERLSQDQLNELRPFVFRRREGFLATESAQTIEKARRGRDRKAKRGKT